MCTLRRQRAPVASSERMCLGGAGLGGGRVVQLRMVDVGRCVCECDDCRVCALVLFWGIPARGRGGLWGRTLGSGSAPVARGASLGGSYAMVPP